MGNTFIRNFKLVNQAGVEWDLSKDQNSPIFLNPSGLGLKKNTEYTQTGVYFSITNEVLSQMTIKGELWFGRFNVSDPLPYSQHTRFQQFLARSEILYLKYGLPLETGFQEMQAEVNVSLLDKSEIKGGALKCAIQIDRLEPWYPAEKQSKTILPEGENDKVYDYTYPYFYPSSSQSDIVIENYGDLDTPLFVRIWGECTSPELQLVDVETGKMYAALKIKDSLDTTEGYFEISSEATRGNAYHYIYKQLVGIPHENVYGKIEKNEEGYGSALYARPGRSILRYLNSSESQTFGKVEVEWRSQFNAF